MYVTYDELVTVINNYADHKMFIAKYMSDIKPKALRILDSRLLNIPVEVFEKILTDDNCSLLKSWYYDSPILDLKEDQYTGYINIFPYKDMHDDFITLRYRRFRQLFNSYSNLYTLPLVIIGQPSFNLLNEEE